MNFKSIVAGIAAAVVTAASWGAGSAQAAVAPSDATAASDWSGDGRADIIGPTSDGRLWLYRGDGGGGFDGARTQLGTGWTARDQIRMVGDWDGQPGTDIIARDPGTGALWLYSGDGAGGFDTYKTIGVGWQIFSQIFSPGDWDGDGFTDILAVVKSDGTLRLYSGNGSGGFLGVTVIGSGWARYDGLMMTGDFDTNGLPDFLARNTANGDLRLYRGDGIGGFEATQVVGAGWQIFNGLLGVGDWSGDGYPDVVARLTDGTLRLHRGNGASGWISPYPTIGTNWNTIRFPGALPTPTTPSGKVTARQLLASLPVAAESNSGYNRDYFKHWIDADGDGCNTRAEVLQSETKKAVTYSSGCTVSRGQWYSYYDGLTWTYASDVDIDHMVPLAEAWGSGARSWTVARRQSFANDLAYAYTLEAVTDNVNSSKSDRDPAQWMPPRSAARCTYAIRWIAVKYRWKLSIDSAERSSLSSYLSGSCGDTALTKPTRP